jgi:Flp pilus assembly protein TadB
MDATRLLGVLAAGIAAVGLGALLVPPTRRLAGRVRPYTVVSRARYGALSMAADLDPAPTSPVMRVVGPPLRALLARLGRLVERRTDDDLALTLRRAGHADVSPSEYRARTAMHVLVLGGAGLAVGVLVLHRSVAAIALGACGVAVGASRLRGRIDRDVADRRERMRLELYTVNQLLALNVRTGAGPIQATQRVVDRGCGAVVDELDDVLDTIRSGVPEPEAFRRAAVLTAEPAAARTYKLFATGAERGVDLADGLRALSEDLRDARREEIRRNATKRRAAMLVPTIAVLAPVMLLFIAAPLPSIVFGSS